QAEDVRPPDAYIIGPGDVVSVNIFGTSSFSGTFPIGNEGYVQPRQMSRINLKGLSFAQAKKQLEREFAKYYRFAPEEFAVNLNYSRTLTVSVYGEALNTGDYNLPAINTAFNALVAAGGPSDIGSVRNITLRRGREAKRIDVYKFMLEDPSIIYDFYLEDNDIIFIPVADCVIEIQGAVRRPFKYELIEGEQLRQLIKYAGGFNANAYQRNLQIKRFVDDEEVIIDVDYRELARAGSDFKLLGGDVVIVKTIPAEYENFVEITGAVENEGRFELSPNMKLTDLLEKGILDRDARTDAAFLLRTNDDETLDYIRPDIAAALADPTGASNLVLQPRDRLDILSQTKFIDANTFNVEGAVRNPSEHKLDAGKELKVEDAILLAGGLLPEAVDFAYIRRTDPNNQKAEEYIRVNVKEAINNPASTSNIALKPQDRLIIYSYKTFTDDAYVRVAGAVRNPGEYKYDPSLSIKDALT
ncbi:MAG: SLBB domain-containing protein, partial [Bacteroidota bacterium]